MTEYEYRIRHFQPEDLKRVVHINKLCLPENYPDSFFLLIYSSFPEGFLVAEDKEIVAYTMNRVETGSSHLNKTKRWPLHRIKKGHVISIAVMPYARRKGLGLKLMLRAMDEMVKKGAEECFLEVRESNESAIALYEKLGFQKVKLLRHYYSDNENAYTMAVKLPLEKNFDDVFKH